MSCVVSNLGTSTARGSSAGAPPLTARPALRARRPTWRDPRLWVGVALVAGSVVGGARLLASADDTVPVWSAAHDLGAGAVLTPGDLVVERVRFGDEALLRGYLPADEPVPEGVRLERGVGAGELVPRAAVAPAAETGTVEVPVAVDPELVPPSVGPGSVVDVYVVAAAAGEAPGSGSDTAALSGVSVVAAPDVASSFGTSGKRQLVLAVPEEAAPEFFAVLGSLSSPVIIVVGRS